ncbi:CotS family spore coat protein [Clostridium senegalense]|uniref:CotS family spore coat protein n=1 Tax=Clostridium senegalense TaxID=1465809 RepID=UPI00028974C8|nr:CotS family spore coat protein [Clostridium senegalense]
MSTLDVSKNNSNFLTINNVKTYVIPHYDLNDFTIEQIKFKNTDKQRAVYKIVTPDNTYCLKKVYYPAEELMFVYSAIEWIYRHNIHVPRILPTKNHGRFVNYNDMLFILTPWIDGLKCNFNSQYEILLAAETLGKIHSYSKLFQPISESKIKVGCSNLYKSINKHFNNLLVYFNLACRFNDNYSKIYLKSFEINIKSAQLSNYIASLIDESYLSKSICHNDYVSKNLILDIDDNVWVIDFDKCKIDYCALDIGYCLRRVLRKEKINWNFTVAMSFFEEYELSSQLTLDDYKYLLSYLSFPQKYWKLSRDYFGNINKCNKKVFCKMLKKATKDCYYQYDFSLKFKGYIEQKFNTRL